MTKTSTCKLIISIGSIISIIYAVIIVMAGIFLLFCSSFVTYDLIVEILTEDGSIVQMTETEINTLVSITKGVFVFGGIYAMVIGVLQLVFAILLNSRNSNTRPNTGFIITLLILSLFTGNLLTTGLMIAALCIKVEKNMDEVFVELDKPEEPNTQN